MAEWKLEHISKHYPGVKALDDVSLTFIQGEIHALCGENGAGKSTLMSVLSGTATADSGMIFKDGKAVSVSSPLRAQQLGIAIVHQHLSLCENLSVAENVFANRQPTKYGLIDYARLHQQTKDLMSQLKLSSLEPGWRVAELSQAQKQMIEIVKAISQSPELLILDEPTASLTIKESQLLFSLLQQLRANGVTVIYISHRLEEIFAIADRVSVLKDGKYQGSFGTKTLDKAKLIRHMVGREVQEIDREPITEHAVSLSIENLSGAGFQDISFNLHRGEILGLYGLIGAGRTEMAKAIFGMDKTVSGAIYRSGRKIAPRHPAEAVEFGIMYLPEDRKAMGIFPDTSIEENIVVSNPSRVETSGLFDPAKSYEAATEYAEKLRVIAPGVHQKVGILSGGNQQKVVLAKGLFADPEVLIIDEPTHGIDIGARFEIYELLKTLATEGRSILMISSDLPELIGLCDRILVMRQGKLNGEVGRENASEEKIIELAF